MNNLLSVRQAAFILKVHPLSIRRYIKEEKLKAVKVGGNVRITEEELQQFHKAVTPKAVEKNYTAKIKRLPTKEFSQDDPLLRLQGRAASLNLS